MFINNRRAAIINAFEKVCFQNTTLNASQHATKQTKQTKSKT